MRLFINTEVLLDVGATLKLFCDHLWFYIHILTFTVAYYLF